MTTTTSKKSESAEFGVLLTILGAVAVMAGAASFSHVHDFTMEYSPKGTDDWFGWANAVISDLAKNPVVTVQAEVRGPLAEMLTVVAQTPVAGIQIVWRS